MLAVEVDVGNGCYVAEDPRSCRMKLMNNELLSEITAEGVVC
jgi:hypothetical protein